MGKLTLVIGPMFAGKSSELLRMIHLRDVIGHKTVVINHSSDKRYGDGIMSTHHGLNRPAYMLPKLGDVYTVCPDIQVSANLLIIDEGQFFPDLVEHVSYWADKTGIDIVVAGLDGDIHRKPMGRILELIPMADEVIRLTALCTDCKDGTVAIFSKLRSGIAIGGVGGAEKYKAVCRKHYLETSEHSSPTDSAMQFEYGC